MPWSSRTSAILGFLLHHLLGWMRNVRMWGATRAQLIQMGIRLLRVLREQLRDHKFIPCQKCSSYGCLPAESPVPQWGSLGTSHAEVLGCPLGFRLFKTSLNMWFNFRQTQLRNRLNSLTFLAGCRRDRFSRKTKFRVYPGSFMAQLLQD